MPASSNVVLCVRLLPGSEDARAALNTQLVELTETLLSHSEAWPFLEPVSVAEAPDYFDVIKDPIGMEPHRLVAVCQMRACAVTLAQSRHPLPSIVRTMCYCVLA